MGCDCQDKKKRAKFLQILAGDWQPTELDGGRLCEAISRGLLQIDTGRIDHYKLPGKVREDILNNNLPHKVSSKDRYHLAKVIEVVYGFRSDRGAVHISSDYTANYMDSMLVIHTSKWIFAEFLRLAWNQDRKIIAETIAQIVQLEHSVIHELAKVTTTQQLKVKYEEVKTLDMRRKASWEKALTIIQNQQREFETWVENPPEEYKDLFLEIKEASEEYDQKSTKTKKIVQEVLMMANSLEALADECQDEAAQLEAEVKVLTGVRKQAKLN